LIDGAFVPDAARLFFGTPLWRNFFENTLTVQFDHRMLAYAICLGALLHAFDVARTKNGPALASAIGLAAAVTVQAALGIWMLLMAAPIDLALMHQMMAMVVLTAATLHAANVKLRTSLPLIPAQAAIQSGSPLSRGRTG
jgi:cytochrome c oxidase assembly protein subunit 15